MGTPKYSSRPDFVYLCSAVLICCGIFFAAPVSAQVVRNDSAVLDGQSYPYVYKWSNATLKPKAVVVAIHGLIMHGLIFDALATHLAEQGIVVLAPDLRGHGRWCQGNGKKGNQAPALVAYGQSQEDLLAIVAAAKADYPNVPLYCLGESLGAAIALYAAGENPACVDGLILSSPAVKHRVHITHEMFEDVAKQLTNPVYRQVNMVPYIKKFASNDPRIVDEYVKDPLVRKRLTPWDLIKSAHSIRPTLKYASKIHANVPVLVIQGSKDEMLHSKAVINLVSHLNSEDQTVKWFKNHGHVMLETAFVQPDVMQAVDRWLNDHISTTTVAAKVADPSKPVEISHNHLSQPKKD